MTDKANERVRDPRDSGSTGKGYFVVDRREGSTLVIIDDAGTQIDVAASEVHADCRQEGAVLLVPIANGSPDWKRATRDKNEEARRSADAMSRVRELERSDPGGDVAL